MRGQERIGDDLGQVFAAEAMREEGEIIGAGLQVLVLQKALVLTHAAAIRARANLGAFFTVIPLCQNHPDEISITPMND